MLEQVPRGEYIRLQGRHIVSPCTQSQHAANPVGVFHDYIMINQYYELVVCYLFVSRIVYDVRLDFVQICRLLIKKGVPPTVGGTPFLISSRLTDTLLQTNCASFIPPTLHCICI